MRAQALDTTTSTPTTSPPQPTISGTPSSTYTPEVTISPTPTTTLAPLPAITLIFPAHTATPTITKTPLNYSLSETPTPKSTDNIIIYSPRIKVLTGVVIILWLLLAGFLIIYLRQLR